MGGILGQLHAYVYHEEGTESRPYGMSAGQVRSRLMGSSDFYVASWYNGRGENIGCGDVSAKDVLRLARELEPDDTFIVVSQSKEDVMMSHQPGTPRAVREDYSGDHCPHCKRDSVTGRYIYDVDPGIDKVLNFASIVVRRGMVGGTARSRRVNLVGRLLVQAGSRHERR